MSEINPAFLLTTAGIIALSWGLGGIVATGAALIGWGVVCAISEVLVAKR